MALILSLESSTSVCSVAVHLDGKLLDSEFISEARASSTRLMVSARNLLDRNSIMPNQVTALAVSSGPGSYTGLRIATSAAKGFCYALNVPLIVVNSLLVLSYPVVKEQESDLYCPMLDARRSEVYCVILNGSLEFVTKVEAHVLTTGSFENELEQNTITFFGDGSEKFSKMVNHPHAIFVDGVQPNAKNLGYLAFDKYVKSEFESVELFEPFYLKDFMVKKASNKLGV